MYPHDNVASDLDDDCCQISVADLWPILICLLGEFRVLRRGHPVHLSGGKAEQLLRQLCVQPDQPVQRDQILETIWPGHPQDLSGQSLNSLTYSLRKLFGDEIGGDSPVVHEDGYYRLNQEAGVGVDIIWFENLIKEGDQHLMVNNGPAAIPFYAQATQLYRGDLCAGTDIRCVMVRERLRAHFLTVLAHLADYYFSLGDYGRCLQFANQLLKNDACREDAHRLVMRCYVRRGERAQALHQYRLCIDILRAEFDAVPEQQTVRLYDQVRLSPHAV